MPRRKIVLIALGALALLTVVALLPVWYAPIGETRVRRASDCAAAVAAVDAPDSTLADYSADLWNPQTANTAVVTVYRVQDSEWAMDVLVEWESVGRTSRVLSMDRNYAPK